MSTIFFKNICSARSSLAFQIFPTRKSLFVSQNLDERNEAEKRQKPPGVRQKCEAEHN